VIEPRRGFKQYGDDLGLSTDRAKQLMVYKERILRHYASSLEYDDGSGTFTAFNGSYSETETGRRMRYVEANGNLYFTTSAGIKKISALTASAFTSSANYIRNAGGVPALDVTGTANYSTTGFFINPNFTATNAYCKVAYRITWAYKDSNSNLVEGSPSSRVIVTNYAATQSGTVDLSFAIPPDIGVTDTQFYYRIYRTQVQGVSTLAELDDLDPGDEMNLVIEDFPSTAQLTARLVTVNDPTPEDFREGGELLYTNPVSGEGITQSNEPPPLAKDVALYQNTVFYANTQTIQQLDLALLGVTALTSGTSTITITQGVTTNTYKFRGVKEISTVTTVADVAGSLNNKYFFINSASDQRRYYVWFNVAAAGTDPAVSGRIPIAVALSSGATANAVASAINTALNATVDFTSSVLGNVVTVTNVNNGNTTNASAQTSGFAVAVTQQGDGEDQALKEVLLSGLTSPSQAIDETARSLVNIINNNTSEVVNAFYLSGPDDVPGLILLKARSLAGAAFTVTANSTATGDEFSPALPTAGTSVISGNETEPNALYFSKFQQPEAVPIVNKFNVGPKDKQILRILPLRDSLFVLKEDGIYRVTGQAGSFTLDPFDNSAILLAPDSAVVLNNQIYMLSSQGVVTLSDTGVSVISRPIEGILDRLTSTNFDFRFTTWGLAYESDRAYHIWLVTNTTDTVATQGFRFNTFTNSWTRSNNSKVCGVVNSADDKLYLGPGDENFIEQERKDFLRTDYADREFTLTTVAGGINGDIMKLSSVTEVEAGDTLLQDQYLTIDQFNQLLKKLDLDPFVTDKDYYSTLGVSSGVNFRNALNNLATKLDADAGVNNNTFSAAMSVLTTFAQYQTDFNTIVTKLNTASGVLHPNFRSSTGTIAIETPILDLGSALNTVQLQFEVPFIAGDVMLVKGVKSDVIWAPQTFGDPSIMKQIREGTVLLEDTVFYSGQIGYATDLSPDFQFVDFNEAGLGDWGLFTWSEQNWGGEGSQVPLRTYVPRDKQRCRFIKPRFKHSIAREKFALFGISLTFRSIGERAYRS
jgi:hypothetical protein